MITFAYTAKSQNAEFENHLKVMSGISDAEVIYLSQMNFAKAYNKALKKSKNDIVVFVREDIRIESEDFGIKLLESFEKSQFGIIGVVGSTIVPMSGLVWEKEEPLVGRIWYENFEASSENRFSEVFRNKIIPVVTVDDSFFAVSKKRLVSNFDPAFVSDSFYEFDFCIKNYAKGIDVGVTFDVKVVKLGINEKDDHWKKNQKEFVKRHQDLPFRIKPKILMSTASLKLDKFPKVSIIIRHKNKPVELASCLESIKKHSNYPNLEIFVVDLGSKGEAAEEIGEFIDNYPNATLVEGLTEHLPSSYEEVIQAHISDDTELYCFIDVDVILLNDAISRMVKVYLEDPEGCGTLGIRMHMKNNMIRHFGLQLLSTETKEGFELGLGYHGFQSAYRYKNKVVKNVLGTSRDFLMISRKLYHELGGFNKEYVFSLEDFELNIASILNGNKNHLVGSAVCYYTGMPVPKFLPDDFLTLVNFVNKNVEIITPYVDLIYVS